MLPLIKDTLISQYNKTLDILSHVIKKYYTQLWDNESDYNFPAWQLAYHAVYFGNKYCASSEKDIIRWPGQKEKLHLFIEKTKRGPEKGYSKEEILDFLEFFRSKIESYLEKFKPEEDCWPHWYDENQLEFHINNIRHIQHHTAEMIERADRIKPFSYEWL